MKGTVFLANIEYGKSSGIYKKIYTQCRILSLNSESMLICKQEQCILFVYFNNGKEDFYRTKNLTPTIKNLLFALKKIIKENDVSTVYFRSTLKPTILQVNLLRFIRKNKIKILYEIPTYPYFGEQIKSSKNKILTIFKMIYEKFIFHLSYHFVDKVIVIISKSNIKRKTKFLEITNGVELSKFNLIFNEELNELDQLNFVGVGTLYNYHGYERLIKSISQYDDKICNVNFYIVGDGPAIENLKQIVKKLGLENNVFFTGVLFDDKLDEIFSKANIGVGALALYERNADIDTTLKVVEYISRGIPVITSGRVKGIKYEDMIFTVENNDSNFNLLEIIDKYIFFRKNFSLSMLEENRKNFDWLTIMEKIQK